MQQIYQAEDMICQLQLDKIYLLTILSMSNPKLKKKMSKSDKVIASYTVNKVKKLINKKNEVVY